MSWLWYNVSCQTLWERERDEDFKLLRIKEVFAVQYKSLNDLLWNLNNTLGPKQAQLFTKGGRVIHTDLLVGWMVVTSESNEHKMKPMLLKSATRDEHTTRKTTQLSYVRTYTTAATRDNESLSTIWLLLLFKLVITIEGDAEVALCCRLLSSLIMSLYLKWRRADCCWRSLNTERWSSTS